MTTQDAALLTKIRDAIQAEINRMPQSKWGSKYHTDRVEQLRRLVPQVDPRGLSASK